MICSVRVVPDRIMPAMKIGVLLSFPISRWAPSIAGVKVSMIASTSSASPRRESALGGIRLAPTRLASSKCLSALSYSPSPGGSRDGESREAGQRAFCQVRLFQVGDEATGALNEPQMNMLRFFCVGRNFLLTNRDRKSVV